MKGKQQFHAEIENEGLEGSPELIAASLSDWSRRAAPGVSVQKPIRPPARGSP